MWLFFPSFLTFNTVAWRNASWESLGNFKEWAIDSEGDANLLSVSLASKDNFLSLNQGFVDKQDDVLGTSAVKTFSGIYLIDLIIIIVVMGQPHNLTAFNCLPSLCGFLVKITILPSQDTALCYQFF